MIYPRTKEEADALREQWRREHREAKRIGWMHEAHGIDPAHTCGECAHLVRLAFSRAYHKCALFRISGGPATDWRLDRLREI